MRARLYGSLGVLAVIFGLAVVLGEASEGALTGWDVAVAIAGYAAMLGGAVVAVFALVYEVHRWRERSRSHA